MPKDRHIDILTRALHKAIREKVGDNPEQFAQELADLLDAARQDHEADDASPSDG